MVKNKLKPTNAVWGLGSAGISQAIFLLHLHLTNKPGPLDSLHTPAFPATQGVSEVLSIWQQNDVVHIFGEMLNVENTLEPVEERRNTERYVFVMVHE